MLGQWIAARGVARDVTVIVKGAHSPYCVPDAIGVQLDISLERLGLDHAPVYIMHRDNPAVPVGEFVTALNRLKWRGRIGAFGGSNWTPERLAEANAWAVAHDMTPMTIMNNNLSLAVMEKPVWAGCITANTPQTLGFLRQGGLTHVSWSSQARGYFLPETLRDRPARGYPARNLLWQRSQCRTPPSGGKAGRRARRVGAQRGHRLGAGPILPVLRPDRSAQPRRDCQHAARCRAAADGGRGCLA